MAKKYTVIKMAEWIKKNEIRLFFSSGKVVELRLPWIKSLKNAKILLGGAALDPGNKKEVSSIMLAEMKGKVLLKGKRGWAGS